MTVIPTVAQVVAPVFMLATLGFLWVRLGYEYRIRFVTQLAMTLAVPCLLFTSLMQTKIEPAALTSISLAAIASYAAITLVLWAFCWALSLDRRTYLAPLNFGNTGNLGLPLALFAFGEEGLALAIVVFAIMAIYSFTFGIWLVSGQNNFRTLVREPMVGATLLGALFMWQGWQTPLFLTNTLELIGQMAIPLMLITLGVSVARLQPLGLPRAFWLSLAKAAICTGIAWSVGAWFNLGPVAFAVLVLQCATPVAVTAYMIAEKYEADAQTVGALVVVSTLLSIGVLSLILGLVM